MQFMKQLLNGKALKSIPINTQFNVYSHFVIKKWGI